MTPQVPRMWVHALLAGRAEVNSAVLALTADGLPAAGVAGALREVGPAFESRCAHLPPAVRDAWGLALALATVDAVGARSWSASSVAPWTLREVATRVAASLGAAGVASTPEEARAVLADVVAAAGQVWRCGDVGRWAALLLAAVDGGPEVAAAGSAARDLLRRAGAVAAWRAGHVRLRDAAHRLAPGLPPELLARCLGVDGADGPAAATAAAAALAANADDPVAWPPDETPGQPTTPVQALQTVGGFTGFGGPFRRPPHRVEPRGPGRWLVVEDAAWELLADAHGTWLVRLDEAAETRTDPASGPASTPPRQGRALLLDGRGHVLVHARTTP